jgi:hypothetical protein
LLFGLVGGLFGFLVLLLFGLVGGLFGFLVLLLFGLVGGLALLAFGLVFGLLGFTIVFGLIGSRLTCLPAWGPHSHVLASLGQALTESANAWGNYWCCGGLASIEKLAAHLSCQPADNGRTGLLGLLFVSFWAEG